MIKVGDTVKIVYSSQLMDMGMLPFANRLGRVLEIRAKNVKSPGLWLEIVNDFGEPEEWFVPIQSIRTKEYDLHKRNRRTINSVNMK